MADFSPWSASGLLAGARQRLTVAGAAALGLWLAVLWASIDVTPPEIRPRAVAAAAGSAAPAAPLPATLSAPVMAPVVAPVPVPPPLRAVAVSGAGAPGSGSYDRFGLESQTVPAPANARGDIAFFAQLMRSSSAEGLFLARDGHARLVAAVGGALPGGGTIAGFTEHPTPALNDNGTLAFTVTAEGGGATDALLTWTDGRLATVAQSGAKAPGIGGSAFFDFGPPAINNAAAVAFMATARRGRETVDGIFLARGGQIAKVIAAGDAAPGGGKFAALGAPALNGKSAVAFAAVVEGGEAPGGVFVANGSDIRRLVGAGDPVPGGGMFTRLSERVSLDDTGRVAFGAYLGQGAPRSGLFVAGDTIAPLAMLGAPAPGGGKFVGFGDAPSIAPDGSLAFIGAVEGGPGPISIYAGDGPTALARIAGVGDPVVGGQRIVAFPLNTAVAVGSGRRVTFHASVQEGGEEQVDAILSFVPPAR